MTEAIKTETIRGISIYFKAIPTEEPIDCNMAYYEDIVKQVESGKLVHFTANVSAHVCGVELASDYLGDCFYANPEDFTKEQESYYFDMVQNVVEEALDTLAVMQSEVERGATTGEPK